MYQIYLSKQAVKDKSLLKQANLHLKAKSLLDLMVVNPFKTPPPYEKLVGDLKNYYSRRINRQHRLIYDVDKNKKIIRVFRMWTHYE